MPWGKRLNRWHDEVGPFHLLREDGSPACGCSYFATTGPYPDQTHVTATCGNCGKIAAKADPRSWRAFRAAMAESAKARARGLI